jgi:hypothetical protein
VTDELQLRPPETSIARPTPAELRERIARLAGREAAEDAPMEYTFSGEGGRATRVVLEGSADGVERIRLRFPEGESALGERLCLELARELRWTACDSSGRRLEGQAAPARAGSRGRAAALRPGLMMLCVLVVLVAVALWHAGQRRDDLWLGVVSVAAAGYFALRVWGLLDRPRSRRPRP